MELQSKKIKQHKAIQLVCPEPSVTLPAVITSIQIQSTKKDRCSIFVRDQFLIGVDQPILLKFGFRKGDILSQEQWEELWESEQIQKVFHWLLNRLELRAHAKMELKQKASIKGFPAKWIDPALEKVERLGLIDDSHFAKLFARDKQKFKAWGWIKISFELRKKGISESILKQVYADVSSEFDSIDEIKKLLLKRVKHFSREVDVQKRKRKMMTYLAGKGYSMSDIMKVINK